MKGAIKIISGLALIIAGIWTYFAWPTAWHNLKTLFWLIVGNVGLYVFLIGLVILILGFTDLGE